MSATKSKGAVKDPVQRAMTTAEKAAEMESEGQGQSMSVPPAPKARPRKTRATTDAEGAAPAESIEDVHEGAGPDQDIDTAGTEMDEER